MAEDFSSNDGIKVFGFEIKRSKKKEEVKSPSIVPPRDDEGGSYATASHAANPANPAPVSCISLIAWAGTNFDLSTPNKSTKLIKKYFIFFSLAILNKFFDIN